MAPSPGQSVRPRDQHVSASKPSTYSRLPTKPSTLTPLDPQPSSHAQLQLNLSERPYATYHPAQNVALYKARAGQVDTKETARFGISRTTIQTGSIGTAKPKAKDDPADGYPDFGASSITPTPSLVSASSMSTQDSPKTNVLRRKPSVIGTYTSRQNFKESSLHHGTEALRHTAIAVQPDMPTSGINYEHVNYYERSEFSMFPKLHATMQDMVILPPPTPLSEPSSFTPSLRYTESPSTFSQVTTPTTRTSYSPLVAASPQIGVRPLASPSKYSASYDQSRPSSSRKHAQSPDEPFGHPFFRETAIRSTSPRKKLPESDPSGDQVPSFRQRSKLTKVRPTDKSPAPSIPKALRSGDKIHPPELAHLSDHTSLTQTLDQPPPLRPSRNGTPSLISGQKDLPIVYSNLSSLRPGSQRRSSLSGHRDAERGVGSPLKETLDETRTLQEAPNPHLPESSSKVSLASSGSSTSTPNALPDKVLSTKPTSRFGFFSRKAKTVESPVEQPRLPKKGPAAGTGHEGYGKHAAKPRSGRAGASSGSTTVIRKVRNANHNTFEQKRNSTNQSDSDFDDFLTQRLNPIYMRGDGSSSDVAKNSMDACRTDSRQSTIEDDFQISPSLDSPKTSQTSRSSMDPASFARPYTSPTSDSGSKSIGGKLNDIAIKSPSVPALTPRSAIPKSLAQGWSSETSLESVRPPKQQNSKLPFAPQHRNMSSSEESPTRQEPPKHEEVVKRKKANWIHIMRSSNRGKTVTEQGPLGSEDATPLTTNARGDLPVHVISQSTPKPVAHYTMLDDSEEHVPGLEDIQKYMEEAKFESDDNWSSDMGTGNEGFYHARTTQTPPSASENEPSKKLKSVTIRKANLARTPRSTVTALSSKPSMIAPTLAPNEKKVIPHGPVARPSRPSRLPQVGRIPKVISTRPPERSPPERSFSRPFAGSQVSSQLEDPKSPISAIVDDSSALDRGSARDGAHEEAIIVDCSDQLDTPSSESAAQTVPPLKLFTFASRKGSITSYSSSSAASFFPTAVATAVVPGPGSPFSEDEVWTEYDDLLDDVVSPVDALPASAPAAKQVLSVQQLSDTGGKPEVDSSRDIFARDFGAGQFIATGEDKDKEFGTASLPLKPGWSQMDDNSPPARNSRRVTFTGSERTSTSTEHSNPSCSGPKEQMKHKRSTSLNQILELSKTETRSSEHVRSPIQRVIDPQYMANLRFGALMTSKWLSFGRVLFSPIQLELKGPEVERLLVIDGLGKDWSYYCALTYPDTSVYCLGPSPSTSRNRQSLGGWQSLPNHRHFLHTDWTSNFPFPKGFFAAVVFRFPSAMSDISLRSTLSECKRVLRPGGYIEVSALDLDLNNMGNIARKAIRELKIKMQAASPDISVKPMSDQIQTLLGRRGFENLNRCVVGIPAAGIISDSREASIDENQKTLTELVHDSSQEGDESITKMVSRVGRWWYARCYEMNVLSNGDLTESVWNDRTLLRECERLSTTFKLLICYAQKPSVTKRRTVSL